LSNVISYFFMDNFPQHWWLMPINYNCKLQKDLWINIFSHLSGLRADLKGSLFGQHIASDVVLKTVSSFMTDSNPNKPLVFSFHGTTGTGKSHVTKIIARNLYKKGEQSKHIHLFISDLHFPDKRNLDTYTAQLKQWIHGNVSNFPRSMFIFDEMDRMHPRLIDTLKPFLDNNDNVDGVSFNKHVCSAGGFSHSSLINKHLIDHYVPFLPLELKHVRQCVMAEMVHLNMTQDSDLADEVARDMPYYPEEERIYAFKGCKSVRQKLPLYK
uniref:Torsin family 1 like 3 n=1 Tax=Sinocyclocheilus grahami TaxID=75366 RepID=A0A672NXZ8_SINGR